jgi:hypothetical protein
MESEGWAGTLANWRALFIFTLWLKDGAGKRKTAQKLLKLT